MKICVISPFTGLAGDMLLAALVDAGAPLERIRSAVAASGLTGWELRVQSLLTHGLTAARALVDVTDDATSRPAAELIAMAGRVEPAPVAERSVAALRAIAEAEGRLHGEAPERVHLHELGGHDTLVDVIGVFAALDALEVSTVYCGALPLGGGTVRTAHGVLPCPAPATASLLKGARTVGSELTGETVTPTAAALLKAAGARFEPPPEFRLLATGYGAGTRSLPDRPNVAVVHLGETADAGTRELMVLETNLDDVTGEVLGHAVGELLAAGALDAWISPVTMKKGRPAHVLHVLAAPEHASRLGDLVLAETGSLGLRQYPVRRTALERETETVDVLGMPVRRKRGPHGAKPEHDDVVAAARELGLPARVVATIAAGR
ncbi:nickel pincer cofactor biosynthesis protein LarC [Amycolatopsis balhimycina DSM 5908]|uniref:Pyridinium-3,5-bisthiocarboxylic acid mononucleotide nickel insertion protein n=1 Tax=Amycolatopsis balhimycina DSM 5908 TaxID=1081091 RepID=A0A428X023_AMYBA|nr:nickel pincer cofactor biosynthesis protein LarC [Amycolatopsis balhimycina]RSM48703.1 nickel pincer cofactor biosynthesis protein LarC [Amycolatopsis balhimycina DSM 5908]